MAENETGRGRAGRWAGALALAAAVASAAAAYSPAQADRGAETFKANCALCHGEDMSGGAGVPALSGPEFQFGWNGKPAAELIAFVRDKMPPGQIGALNPQQDADIVAAIMRRNGHPAGDADLAVESEAAKAPMALKP